MSEKLIHHVEESQPTLEQRELWQNKQGFFQKIKFGIEIGIPKVELFDWANKHFEEMRNHSNREIQFTLWRLLGNTHEDLVKVGFFEEGITNIRETVARELYNGLRDDLEAFEFYQSYESDEEQEEHERVFFDLCQLAARVAKSIYGTESVEALEIGKLFVAKA